MYIVSPPAIPRNELLYRASMSAHQPPGLWEEKPAPAVARNELLFRASMSAHQPPGLWDEKPAPAVARSEPYDLEIAEEKKAMAAPPAGRWMMEE